MTLEDPKEIIQTALDYVKGKTGFIKDGDWIETKDQDPNGEVRLIQLADIGDGEFLNKSNRYLTKETASRLNCTFLEKGDLLIARMPDPLGRACIFPGDLNECVTAVDVMIIRADKTIINNQWLKFKINSPKIRNTLNRFITGTTRQRISRSNFEKIPLDIPDINTQIRIAELLEKASSLIGKRQETIKLADEFLRSTFLEMFGDPVANSKDWPIKILDDITLKITDGEHLNPELSENGKSLIMAQDVGDDYVDFSHEKYVNEDNFLRYTNKCKPEKEDIVLVSRGATIGRCTTVKTNKEFCLMGSVILIKPDKNKLIARYLEWLFKHSNFNKKLVNISGSSAQQAIYIQNLKLFKVPVPDPILQDYFNAIVIKIEALKEKYRSSLTEMENQFNSLMQKAFRGEL